MILVDNTFENVHLAEKILTDNICENIAQIVTGCFQATGWPGVVSVMANWFGKVNIALKEDKVKEGKER